MAEKNRWQKASNKGMILGICPDCQGTGKVPKQLPFGANPRAPATRADRLGMKTCLKCNGTGKVGMG